MRTSRRLYAICVGIVLPEAGLGRHDALQDVVTGLLIRVPERVGSVRKGLCHRFCRRVEAFLAEHFDKGQVHINVVEEAWETVIVEFQVMLGISNLRLVWNHDASIAELCRASIGTTDGLSSPTAFDFVEQHIAAYRESCPCFER